MDVYQYTRPTYHQPTSTLLTNNSGGPMLIALIAAWCLGSLPVALLVGRMIRAGRVGS